MENTYLPGPANILIVDDRPDNLLVLSAVLEGSPDYKITTASSGWEAIELVKQIDFALILLDIQMPVMDGYEPPWKSRNSSEARTSRSRW